MIAMPWISVAWMASMLLLVHPTSPQTSPDASDALAFFERYVDRVNSFDAEIGELFSPEARITTLRDGTDRFELSGEEWRQLVRRTMPVAEKVGEQVSFEEVEVEAVDRGFRITGRRLSNVKCVPDDEYSIVVVPTESDDFEILEEHTTTVSLSECPASDQLAEVLASAREQLLPLLPLDLDDDTRLVGVDVRGRSFIYRQQIHTLTKDDLDLDELGPLLRSAAVGEVCGHPSMRAMVDAGATVRYSYTDSEAVHLLNADVTPGVCELLE